MVAEIPPHLLERSRARRAALSGGGDDAPAEASSSGGTSTAVATAEPAAPARAAAAPAPAAPAGPVPSIGVPVAAGGAVTPKTRVPIWVMPVLALLPFWAFLYQGAFGEEEVHEEAAAGSVEASTEAPAETVDLVGLEFVPTSISVSVGETVKWIWTEPVAHNVTGDGGLDSGTMNGPEYSAKFTAAGRFPYECTLHPGMEGVVEVEG